MENYETGEIGKRPIIETIGEQRAREAATKVAVKQPEVSHEGGNPLVSEPKEELILPGKPDEEPLSEEKPEDKVDWQEPAQTDYFGSLKALWNRLGTYTLFEW